MRISPNEYLLSDFPNAPNFTINKRNMSEVFNIKKLKAEDLEMLE